MNKYLVFFHGTEWYVKLESGAWLTKRFTLCHERPATPFTKEILTENECKERGIGYFTQIPRMEFHREKLEDVAISLSEYAGHMVRLHEQGFKLLHPVKGDQFIIRAPMNPAQVRFSRGRLS